jgi:predicted permease
MPLILLTIVVALAAGAATERRSNRAALRARTRVLRTMLWLLVPFAIYVNIARLHLSLAVGVGVVAGLTAVTLGGTLAWLAARGPLRLARPSAGAAIVCTIQANTAYLGLPLCAALFTHAQLTQAIAYDSLVSLPAFVLGSFTIGTLLGEAGRERERRRLRDLVLRNPPLVAVITGLLVPHAWAPHALVEPSRIAIYAMLPLGFFVVGVTLADEADEGALSFPPPLTRPVALVVLLRMALTPAVLGLVSLLVVTLPAPFLVLAAMPVGVNTVIVAHATGLDLRLTSAAIAWTTTVALAGIFVLWATGIAG